MSASGPASGSNFSSGRTSWIAPRRAPVVSTWLSASSSTGSADSGWLPVATSVTASRYPVASRAVSAASASRTGPSTRLSCGALCPAVRRGGPARCCRSSCCPPCGRWRVSRWSAGAAQASSRRRPSKARPRVTSSAYSRSPPTGRPEASRVTAQAHRPQRAGEEGRGGLALEVRVGGDDDLGDGAVGQPGHQLADAQVVRADAVDRADRPAEHVVPAAELTGALDGDDVLRTPRPRRPPSRRDGGRGRSGTGPPPRRCRRWSQNRTRALTSVRATTSRWTSAGSWASR